jgi:transcriptional regulator with XRE-family HTH domain
MKRSRVIDRARARRADSRDMEVAHRVRSRRLECRLSQTALANRIGVTFQQVQKYENGVNRIGAGRLQRIAEALDVPITFFFGSPLRERARSQDQGSESVFALLQTSGEVWIMKAYRGIKSRRAKQLIVDLTEELAK